LEAEISLSYKTDKQARAVADAVSPDNVKIPEGLTIKMKKQGRNVLTYIKCGTSMLTFIATIDDLLAAVSVAERSISTVKSC
jgi:tRNA threonylcarbamoyladenosine modification (KEOPS) complex  Pcc1 subunit